MIQKFILHRHEDVSGMSGTGLVAEGVVFTDGTVCMRWLTEHRSTVLFESLDEVRAIHGHDGKTVVLFEP